MILDDDGFVISCRSGGAVRYYVKGGRKKKAEFIEALEAQISTCNTLLKMLKVTDGNDE